MDQHRADVPLEVAFEGWLAGASGALALTGMGAVGRKLMAGTHATDELQADAGISAAAALAEGPDMPPNMNRVTATFVQKLATGVFGTSLSVQEQAVAGTAWHLAYGGGWGTLYGLVQSSVRVSPVALGPLFGLGVWAMGPGWLVPKMRLMLPPRQQQPRTAVVVAGIHVAYGALVAAAFHRLRWDNGR
jgi:hypothetical protein